MQFDVLKKFAQEGPLTVVVNGDCMQRTIPAGSSLRIEIRRLYYPGDAVAFKRGDGKIVCHRLLGYFPSRNGWRVLTQADNSGNADKSVFAKSVLGKATQVEDTLLRISIVDRGRALLRYLRAVLNQIVTRMGLIND